MGFGRAGCDLGTREGGFRFGNYRTKEVLKLKTPTGVAAPLFALALALRRHFTVAQLPETIFKIQNKP